MAKQLTNREKLSFTLDHLTDNEIEEVIEYVSIMDTMRGERKKSELFDDDLGATLSSAYENRRARQVLEWDAVRQHSNAGHQRAAHR